MRANCGEFALTSAGLCFDYDIVAARIIRQIALVYTQEEHSVALCHKFPSRPDDNEVVVIVADNGDEGARGFIAHQLLAVRDVVQSAGR